MLVQWKACEENDSNQLQNFVKRLQTQNLESTQPTQAKPQIFEE